FGKASGFPAVLELSSLDGTNGFRLDGAAAQSVAGAGDVNGDGFADLIVGARGGGAACVVFGSSGVAANLGLASARGRNGFRLDGAAAGDRSGVWVAGGDVNGDGFADVIIGARDADPHGTDSGSSYVVFGRAPDTARRGHVIEFVHHAFRCPPKSSTKI